jgi:predicted nucleotidyltransferase
MNDKPTPYPEVNDLLQELLRSVEAALGRPFVGMYLEGSLAGGDFDEESDIDFVVVTDEEVSGDLFSALAAMHERIAAMDSRWAIQLEGSYLSRRALRRYDPAHALHPNIERGRGERLKMVRHDEGWATHRHILRERGITLVGPPPHTLIDPVSPTDLRQAMLSSFPGWATPILREPTQITHRGYQCYLVLTLCRVLYTLHHGAVVSKPVAARWAQHTLEARWAPLVERAWAARHDAGSEPSPDEVSGTLEFIRYALERGQSMPRRF